MAKKATAIVPTMLRMREELRKRIEREAKKNERSLNAEMVLRLEQSFEKENAELRDGAFFDVLAAAAPKTEGADGQAEIDTIELAKRFADILRPRLHAAGDSNLSRYLADYQSRKGGRRGPATDTKPDHKPPTERNE